ncbi:MAG: hypothetical protein FJZ90_11695 [Chloroflexi bacterium]|nr:hypothetical protein [Chloroflexota bacterium]
MSRKCSICAHQQRQAIDETLVAGTASLREIASLFAVSQSAVRRHKTRHLPVTLAAAEAAAEAVVRSDDLLGKVAQLEADAHRIKKKAEESQDYRTALQGVRELVRIVELLARLRGELDERAQVNILVVSPEWLSLRARILQTLEPYPEARNALAVALGAGDAVK